MAIPSIHKVYKAVQEYIRYHKDVFHTEWPIETSKVNFLQVGVSVRISPRSTLYGVDIKFNDMRDSCMLKDNDGDP